MVEPGSGENIVPRPKALQKTGLNPAAAKVIEAGDLTAKIPTVDKIINPASKVVEVGDVYGNILKHLDNDGKLVDAEKKVNTAESSQVGGVADQTAEKAKGTSSAGESVSAEDERKIAETMLKIEESEKGNSANNEEVSAEQVLNNIAPSLEKVSGISKATEVSKTLDIKPTIEDLDKELAEKLKGMPAEDMNKITRQFYLDRLKGYTVDQQRGFLADTDVIKVDGKVIKKINPFYFIRRQTETNKFLREELIRQKRQAETGEAVNYKVDMATVRMARKQLKQAEAEAKQLAKQGKAEEAKNLLTQYDYSQVEIAEIIRKKGISSGKNQNLTQPDVRTSSPEPADNKPEQPNPIIESFNKLPNADKLLKYVKPEDVEIIAKHDKQEKELLVKGVGDSLMTADEKQSYYDSVSRKNNFLGFLRDQYDIENNVAEKIYNELITRSKENSNLISLAEKPQQGQQSHPTEASSQAPQSETVIESAGGSSLTKDAEDLIKSLELGVPSTVTKNMEHILKENGISQEDINRLPPGELIEKLRAKILVAV
jgi:hypothetical protein